MACATFALVKIGLQPRPLRHGGIRRADGGAIRRAHGPLGEPLSSHVWAWTRSELCMYSRLFARLGKSHEMRMLVHAN